LESSVRKVEPGLGFWPEKDSNGPVEKNKARKNDSIVGPVRKIINMLD